MADTMNAADAAEFTALMAELEAPDADDVEEPTEAEESEETPEETDDAEEETEELEDTEGSLDAAELEAAALLKAGDLKGFCKRLGVDPKLLKVNPREFTAMRKGLADAQKLDKAAKAAKATAEKLQNDAEQVYGPIVAGFRAYKGGDPMQLRAAIELLAEDSLENVMAAVAKASKGLDPAQLEVIKLRKELEAEKTKKAEETNKLTAAETTKKEVATISGRLKGTPLEAIPSAAQEIHDAIKASFDGTGYGLNLKQAYAQVKAKHAKVAEAFGKKTPAPKKNERQPLGRVRPDPTLTPAQRQQLAKQQEEDEFQAVLRETKEAVKRGERAARRSR